MKIILARSALSDLQEIQSYYRSEGVPEVGQQLVAVILDKVERLVDHPDSGRVVPEFNQMQIRELIHPPFRIVYLREAATISLIRVWRSERLLVLPGDERAD